jgi:prepilin-type N-terminal cleavage/methylation domain-containing protein
MTKKGFTLIELMVTVTIMMIMTAVVLFNYNRFNDSSLLNTFAYDLSLTIRQAQVYGSAVRGTGSQNGPITTASATTFQSAYGVHFDSTPNAIPLTLFFAGIGTDGASYNTDRSGDLQSYTFQRGIKINSLCVKKTGTPDPLCATSLDIIFTRPDPEAMIGGDVLNDEADIVLQNADGSLTRTVVVYSTGQIQVK